MNPSNIKFILYLKLSIVIIIGLSACSIQTDSHQPKVLKVSVQPSQSNQNDLKLLYFPLMKYLEKELSIKIVWVKVNNYQHQLDKFHNGELDLALFGGFAFVKALARDNADPLVMRDIDFRFTSYFLVAKDNKVSDISELQGQSFSFGSKLSTSGHIMPRFFLSTQDIVPEKFFSQVLYSGAHDLTALWVQEGKVDVGVANSIVVDKLFKNRALSKNKVRILWKTPHYPDYVWAARKNLSATIKAKIIEAFIKMSADNEQHKRLLELVGANYYMPANSDDFEPIRKIAIQFNLLDE
jgi:phosphonate transport system substrate-binding protein